MQKLKANVRLKIHIELAAVRREKSWKTTYITIGSKKSRPFAKIYVVKVVRNID
tara:strand:- start:672 stop:833 length:162 start_codon:yes stop_codon:yes gene_type:complete